MKMSSISGVVCYVKDLDETAAFYERLGFRMKRDANELTAYVNWFWITFRPQEEKRRCGAPAPTCTSRSRTCRSSTRASGRWA